MSRDLLPQLVSVVSIDAVVSMMIATLYGLTAEPRIEAVEVAVIGTEVKPNKPRKVVGTVACCFILLHLR